MKQIHRPAAFVLLSFVFLFAQCGKEDVPPCTGAIPHELEIPPNWEMLDFSNPVLRNCSAPAAAADSGTWRIRLNTLYKTNEHTYSTRVTGLPSGQACKKIVADRQNTIWGNVYTAETYSVPVGLMKYDASGVTTVYTSANSGLTSNEIIDLAVDSTGRIWAASLTALYSFDGTTWTRYDQTNSPLTQFYPLSARGITVCAGGSSSLAIYDGTTWTNYNAANSNFPSSGIIQTCIASDGSVWALTQSGTTVYRFNAGVFTNVGYPYSNTDDIPRAITADNQGRVYIGSSKKMIRADGSSFTTFETPYVKTKGGPCTSAESSLPQYSTIFGMAFTAQGHVFTTSEICDYFVYYPQ
jgi:streptogramin lyase